MQDRSYLPFTEEMKKDYTILMPNMLPMHFKLLISVMRNYGYNFELLETSGPQIAETGLKYTHNDTCYPAVLVIGQFMDALLSGRYDTHKTALIMFQTGGGCRASNYISLIRKALAKAGMDYVPVISLSMTGIEKHPGFNLSLGQLHRMLYAILYGDLLMNLVNQTRPYELTPGDAERTAQFWIERLGRELGAGGAIRYGHIKENYRRMVRSFAQLPMHRSEKVKVGIVGEIFVKYSPLGNNDLERFLVSEGAETVVPGLVDFCLYCVFNMKQDYVIYKRNLLIHLALRPVYALLCRKRQDISRALTESGVFSGLTPFEEVVVVGRIINPYSLPFLLS